MVPDSGELSFAHAEGRNYRQLPARARLREEPPPADIVYSKRYSLSELDVSGRMIFFLALRYKAKGYFGFGMRVGSGTKWVAERLLWVPRRDAGAFPSSKLLWKATTGGWWSRKRSARGASGIGIMVSPHLPFPHLPLSVESLPHDASICFGGTSVAVPGYPH